jgi:mxaJ protein
MHRRCIDSIVLIAALVLATLAHAAPRTLRVCADPANLPFSNRDGAGFENAIVDLVSREIGARVKYVWWSQLRGFARKTLGSGACDLWPGVPTGLEALTTTVSYYRSSYVFVTRKDRHLDIRSFDDPRLRKLTIGVQLIGNDATNTPPAHALAQRGIVTNVRGYMVYDKHAGASPIVAAVADGTLDVALVWGPTAGFFAKRTNVPLVIAPTPATDAALPMTFAISMGLSKGDTKLAAELNEALDRERPQIARVLAAFGVPRVGQGPDFSE